MSPDGIETEVDPLLEGPVSLRGSEIHFRRLLERLPAGAYTCDPDGLITFFNAQAVTLWGRAPKLNDPADRFCGSFKLFAADGSPVTHAQCWMAQALEKRKEFNGHEIMFERPDGSRLTALAHANPLHDSDGNLLGAVNVLVDITERKRVENLMREADRCKNEFVATLAHELRNPLAPIRNAVELLKFDRTASQEMRCHLEVISRQVKQMARLIDDLMDLARVTSNKLDLQKECVALAEIVHTAVETGRPLMDARGQRFTLDLSPEPLRVYADKTRLAQALSNLLNNAARYTPPAGHITLTAGRQNSEIVISLRDTGAGISPELLPRIFDMFTQVGRSPDQSGGGLGIGLALARRFVEMHGGTLVACSEGLGQGSEFVVRIPLDPASLQPAGPDSEKIPRLRAQVPLRIVVVDDNRDSANTLGKLLRLKGHDVRVAFDGFEALVVADEFQPHIVLLDVGMPQMSGYEVASRLRQKHSTGRMVLIAVTGWGQEGDRRRSAQAGFDHHLVKPVDLVALAGIIQHAAFVVATATP